VLPKAKRIRTIRTELHAIQWLRRMGYTVHHNEWHDGTVIVVNPQTNQSRQFDSALTAQAFLLEQAQVYQQNRMNQNVVQGGQA